MASHIAAQHDFKVATLCWAGHFFGLFACVSRTLRDLTVTGHTFASPHPAPFLMDRLL